MKNKNELPYCVSFDTMDMPGKIKCVRVQLDTIIISESDTVRVDLVDHPLYPKLVEYVRNNPVRKS
jgi:hypothetical protein